MQPAVREMSPAGPAFAGAALFVALIVLFSMQATHPPPILLIAVVAAGAHGVLFPVAGALSAPGWSRAAGYSWLAIDVMLNVATLNGVSMETIMPLRLGGHVLAGLWIATASLELGGAAGAVGFVLGPLLIVHAFLAQWLPPWAIYPPFLLIPIWLLLVGRFLTEGRLVASRPPRPASA
jgi:hypothetical protein